MPLALGSPWAPDNHLAHVVIVDDILGFRVPAAPTRAQAIRVPAVARARRVICGTIARIELAAYRGDTRLDRRRVPSWLTPPTGRCLRSTGCCGPSMTCCSTAGRCGEVTERDRQRPSGAGFPLRMARLPDGPVAV